jgi:hypothetical protein
MHVNIHVKHQHRCFWYGNMGAVFLGRAEFNVFECGYMALPRQHETLKSALSNVPEWDCPGMGHIMVHIYISKDGHVCRNMIPSGKLTVGP